MSAIDGRATERERLISRLEVLPAGYTLNVHGARVAIMDSPLCGRYRIDFADDYRATYVNDAADVLGVVVPRAILATPLEHGRQLRAPDGYETDPGGAMPARVELRHHSLCEAARVCYRLRNERGGLPSLDMQEIGDGYAADARAILAEWEA